MAPLWPSLMLVVLLDVISSIYGAVPSSRSVYYLHTRAVAWAAARDTCARYGGRLVNVREKDDVQSDLNLLDTVLGWDNAFSSLTTTVWTGLYKGVTSSGQPDIIRWHSCEAWTSADEPNHNIYDDLTASPDHCTDMTVDELRMTPVSCDLSRPYICQVNDGQCWFLPVEDTGIKTASSHTEVKGLNECAQLCRNRVQNDTSGDSNECWAFNIDGDNCNLYETSARHSFIINRQNELEDAVNKTVYLKICAGGDITSMHAVTSANTKVPGAENCSNSSDSEAWDSGICYCDCDQPPVILEPEYLVLSTEEKVERIVKELFIDPSNTSAAQRKLSSAEDSRPSAQSLGALGIALIVLVFGGLLILDLNVLFSHVNNRLHTGQVNGREAKVNSIKAA